MPAPGSVHVKPSLPRFRDGPGRIVGQWRCHASASSITSSFHGLNRVFIHTIFACIAQIKPPCFHTHFPSSASSPHTHVTPRQCTNQLFDFGILSFCEISSLILFKFLFTFSQKFFYISPTGCEKVIIYHHRDYFIKAGKYSFKAENHYIGRKRSRKTRLAISSSAVNFRMMI